LPKFEKEDKYMKCTKRKNNVNNAGSAIKAASHRIRLRLTNRLVVNGTLHTCCVGRIRL